MQQERVPQQEKTVQGLKSYFILSGVIVVENNFLGPAKFPSRSLPVAFPEHP